MLAVFFLVCFFASSIGAICGIGGGVIIKPSLDAIGVMDAGAISFLSGCAVFAMSAYSVLRSKASGNSRLEKAIIAPIAIGAAIGGAIGKQMFSVIAARCIDMDKVGAIQAGSLLIITAGTLIYTIFRDKIKTYHMKSRLTCFIAGAVLGIISSFLGIGGGPINIVLLAYLFSMDTKTAAENSLYIIFFSQLTSIAASAITGCIPKFGFDVLLVMVFGGITGGICGRTVNKRIKSKTVDFLFSFLMIVIIGINIYNIYKFL